VYGSLRRGNPHPMSVRFPEAKFVAEAKVTGTLYDLGAYPGMQTSQSISLVTGEVYEVDDATLDEMDEFETSSHYLRKQIEIFLGAARKTGWVYEPDPKHYDFETLISSGDWIEYSRAKLSTERAEHSPARRDD
jgi:gamma-glutamylcyclotransferase (GGCT)/AIG2-like uncharacterized protein YtfP